MRIMACLVCLKAHQHVRPIETCSSQRVNLCIKNFVYPRSYIFLESLRTTLKFFCVGVCEAHQQVKCCNITKLLLFGIFAVTSCAVHSK